MGFKYSFLFNFKLFLFIWILNHKIGMISLSILRLSSAGKVHGGDNF